MSTVKSKQILGSLLFVYVEVATGIGVAGTVHGNFPGSTDRKPLLSTARGLGVGLNCLSLAGTVTFWGRFFVFLINMHKHTHTHTNV